MLFYTDFPDICLLRITHFLSYRLIHAIFMRKIPFYRTISKQCIIILTIFVSRGTRILWLRGLNLWRFFRALPSYFNWWISLDTSSYLRFCILILFWIRYNLKRFWHFEIIQILLRRWFFHLLVFFHLKMFLVIFNHFKKLIHKIFWIIVSIWSKLGYLFSITRLKIFSSDLGLKFLEG